MNDDFEERVRRAAADRAAQRESQGENAARAAKEERDWAALHAELTAVASEVAERIRIEPPAPEPSRRRRWLGQPNSTEPVRPSVVASTRFGIVHLVDGMLGFSRNDTNAKDQHITVGCVISHFVRRGGSHAERMALTREAVLDGLAVVVAEREGKAAPPKV